MRVPAKFRKKKVQIPAKDPVRVLLVDLDGTLLGNKPVRLSLGFAARALRELHKYGSFARISRALLAMRNEMTRPTQETFNDVRLIERFAKAMRIEVGEAERVMKHALYLVFPKLHKYFYPMDGATDFLDWAKNRYTLVLATNPVWPIEIIKLRLLWAGIDPDIFSFITDSSRMTACKPQPKYFTEILQQCGLTARETLLVGNETRMDLPAARIGIRVFIVGKYRRARLLRFKKYTTLSWRGSFRHLREMLEGSLS